MSTSDATPAPEHREVWLAIPGPTPGSAWTDASGGLPYVAFDIEAATTTVGALQREVLPALGVTGPILGCLLRYDEPWIPATVVSGFVELEPQPADWTAPDGWRVRELAAGRDVAPSLHVQLRPRLVDWIAEQCGAAPDPLAPPWSRPGWHQRASDWIGARVAGPIEVEQMRAWGISTVLRATDGDGTRYWFKGICDHFGREVGVTVELDAVAPGYVAPVLAADLDEHWLLLGDLTDVAPAGEPASHVTAYPRLRGLQRAVAGDRDRLISAGAAVRPLADLPDAFADVIRDPELSEWHGIGAERVQQLVAWVAEAVAEVAELQLPEVLVHGDFHPGNVATRGDGTRVIFDWSDAAFAVPFIDVPTWLTWIDDDAAERERTWRSFSAEWEDVLPAEEWLARRPLLEGVAGAYHVVSYAGIVRSMDTHHRAEHGRGIAEFVAFVDAAAPARQEVSPPSPGTA